MMKCSSKIKINQTKIRQLSQAAVVSLEQTAEALHGEIISAGVVPRMDGELEGESFFTDFSDSKGGRVSLVHSTPYARRLYFHPEYNFHKEPWEEEVHHKDGSVSHLKHDGNPNAKGKWFEDWEQGGKDEDFAQKVFKEMYRRNAGL